MSIGRLGNGQRADHLVASLLVDARQAGLIDGDPNDPRVADAAVSWMMSPAGHGAGVNRYLEAAFETRPDLQARFVDLAGRDGIELRRWAWTTGRHELIGELLGPPPPGIAAGTGLGLGVEVVGFLGETLGIGEAARLYLRALMAAGVPVTTRAVSPDGAARAGSGDFTDLTGATPAFTLACLNPDSLTALRRDRPDVLRGASTIGQWGWETDEIPAHWATAFDLVEEVWVYSRFVAENLGRILPLPVVVVPLPIVEPAVGGHSLLAGDDRFSFLYMVDLLSTLERKNPVGLISAFTRAFSPGEGPRLMIKTTNAHLRPDAASLLAAAAGGREDITIVDRHLGAEERAATIADADCYVSLHRAEGFGLTLAEAMALGTSVIATGYSGNLDFMTEWNSRLVDWTPVEVGPGSEVYPSSGHWAEPSLDHAAAIMRDVWERPEESRRRAARARPEVLERFAPRVVGEIARARLERLSDRRDVVIGRRSLGAGGRLRRRLRGG